MVSAEESLALWPGNFWVLVVSSVPLQPYQHPPWASWLPSWTLFYWPPVPLCSVLSIFFRAFIICQNNHWPHPFQHFHCLPDRRPSLCVSGRCYNCGCTATRLGTRVRSGRVDTGCWLQLMRCAYLLSLSRYFARILGPWVLGDTEPRSSDLRLDSA